MSLLYTTYARDGYVTLYCDACLQSVGIVSNEEAAQLSASKVVPLCFDCDPGETDVIPRQLISPDDHYFIGIANYVFLAEWTIDNYRVCPKDLMVSRVSLTTYFDLKTGWGPLYTPLSSWSKSPQVATDVATFSSNGKE